MVYSVTCDIQSPDIFRTLLYSEPVTFRTQAYSEPCQISTMERFPKIVNRYNYFRKQLFSQYQLFKFSTLSNKYDFLNTGLIVTQEVFILSKKHIKVKGAVDREF